jgi:hypothetical protein
MIIDIILLAFCIFDRVEILKVDCHKRKKMVQVKKLFIKLKYHPFFYVTSINFPFLTYQYTRPHRIWWKIVETIYTLGLIRVVWHTNLEMRDKIFICILYDLWNTYLFG